MRVKEQVVKLIMAFLLVMPFIPTTAAYANVGSDNGEQHGVEEVVEIKQLEQDSQEGNVSNQPNEEELEIILTLPDEETCEVQQALPCNTMPSSQLSEIEAWNLLLDGWSISSEPSDENGITAYARDDYWIGQRVYGSCYIGNHVTSGNWSSFSVSFNDAAFSGSTTLWCLDPGAAEPYPQSAPYVATVTAIDYSTSMVSYNIYITPAGAWDGVSYANGLPAGYQHVGGSMTRWRDLSDPGMVQIYKVDKDTGLSVPQGGAQLSGAVYLLTKADTGQTWTMTTNQYGYAEKTELPLGSYNLREIAPSIGYEIDTTLYDFTLLAGQNSGNIATIRSHEPVIKDSIEVTKQDEDTAAPVPGTSFTLYSYKGTGVPAEHAEALARAGAHPAYRADPFPGIDASRWQALSSLETDALGTCIFEGLPYGWYLVHEAKPSPAYAEWWESAGSTWPWYTFFVDGTGTQSQIFENKAIAVECNVSKATIRRTSAAFRSPWDPQWDNVGKERYRYDVSFDSGRTQVRADQYAVVDTFEYDALGIRLEQLTTPVVVGDTDGSYNLWYKTSAASPSAAAAAAAWDPPASATATNPKNPLADGTDRIPTQGWQLWRQGLSTAERQPLRVSALRLPDGVWVTHLMLEFGSVEPGFRSVEPLTHLVYATAALDYDDDRTVIPSSVTSHITRNWHSGRGLYDDAADAVETRVIGTFHYDGSTTPATYRTGGTVIPKTGDAPSLPIALLCASAALSGACAAASSGRARRAWASRRAWPAAVAAAVVAAVALTPPSVALAAGPSQPVRLPGGGLSVGYSWLETEQPPAIPSSIEHGGTEYRRVSVGGPAPDPAHVRQTRRFSAEEALSLPPDAYGRWDDFFPAALYIDEDGFAGEIPLVPGAFDVHEAYSVSSAQLDPVPVRLEGLPTNDIAYLDSLGTLVRDYPSRSASYPGAMAVTALERASVSFEATAFDPAGNPSEYSALMTYRGQEDFLVLSHYEVRARYEGEVEAVAGGLLVTAVFEPVAQAAAAPAQASPPAQPAPDGPTGTVPAWYYVAAGGAAAVTGATFYAIFAFWRRRRLLITRELPSGREVRVRLLPIKDWDGALWVHVPSSVDLGFAAGAFWAYAPKRVVASGHTLNVVQGAEVLHCRPASARMPLVSSAGNEDAHDAAEKAGRQGRDA